MIIRTPNDFGAVVRQARLDAGLTQAELASRVGVSRLWVVKFEQGKAESEVGLALRALRVLGLSLRVEADARPGASAGSGAPIDLNALLAGDRDVR